MATKSIPNKTVIASVSNKGGTGKTVTSKSLALLYREEGKRIAIYDADARVAGLLPALGTRSEKGSLIREQDATVGCGYYDFRKETEAPHFLDTLDEYPDAEFFLHDLPGGSVLNFSHIADGGEEGEVSALLEALDGAGARLKIVMTLSHLLPATESVGYFCSIFKDRADYVAVINHAWGKAEDFEFWFDPSRKERGLFQELGGVEVHMPAIPPAAFAKTEAYHIPFNTADRSEHLKLSQRAQVQGYWRKWREAVEPAASTLNLW